MGRFLQRLKDYRSPLSFILCAILKFEASLKKHKMNLQKQYKIVVFVPVSHADKLREAMGAAGAGKIGNYQYCTFTSKGVGRFTPMDGAAPTIGVAGKSEEVEEERIETICAPEKLEEVLAAIKRVHPYEEPATDVYTIEIAG